MSSKGGGKMHLSNMSVLFLIAHMLADYYLQTTKMAADKEWRGKALCLHMAVYAALMLSAGLVLCLTLGDHRLLWGAFALCALHALADLIKFYAVQSRHMQGPGAQAWIYGLDQLFHILCVLLVMNRFALSLPVSDISLRWALLLLLIHKPANITFKKLLSRYDTTEADSPGTLPGAGAVIGSLERVLCAIFIGLGQYASIGLIYTAKSIARFKKIEENPRFAEYYLIGTLYSILFVVVCYLLIVRTYQP